MRAFQDIVAAHGDCPEFMGWLVCIWPKPHLTPSRSISLNQRLLDHSPGDPHMFGFLGQKFDFTGQDAAWYSLIADDNMHINMRVTSPVPDVPEITYITGMGSAILYFQNSCASIRFFLRFILQTPSPIRKEVGKPHQYQSDFDMQQVRLRCLQ